MSALRAQRLLHTSASAPRTTSGRPEPDAPRPPRHGGAGEAPVARPTVRSAAQREGAAIRG
ncbi:hypothetical protein FM119_12195 [Mycetocola reblochoni REB411]|uniref:Uncharacterized protein n=1 Tax=Mycetocola reblochoni REB411 TaxID=1255698 RepID=A0A1R4K8L6_9MICO|nr:hypothetical protein FM119_12195 [Mycetocola reblochoni REB411]